MPQKMSLFLCIYDLVMSLLGLVAIVRFVFTGAHASSCKPRALKEILLQHKLHT